MLLTIPRFIILFLSPFTSLSKVIKIRNFFWIKSFLRKILRCFSVCHRITSHFPSQFHFTVSLHSFVSLHTFPKVSREFPSSKVRFKLRGFLLGEASTVAAAADWCGAPIWRQAFRGARINRGCLRHHGGIWVAQDDRHLDFFWICDFKLILFQWCKKCFDQCWSQVPKLEERIMWRVRLWKGSTTGPIHWWPATVKKQDIYL